MKFKVSRLVAVLAAAVLVISGSMLQASAATQTVRLYISADTNIQDLWVKTLIPEFNKTNPDYKVEVTFDRNGANDAPQLKKKEWLNWIRS